MRLVLSYSLYVIFFLCSCNNTSTTFFALKTEDVDGIVLHWKEHHYHNDSSDFIKLDQESLEEFIEEFNQFEVNAELHLENKCYELLINYVDGTTEIFDFDGHRVISRVNGHHYTCIDQENLITKFWNITEKDFCVKHE